MLGSVFGALFLWAIFGSNWPAARAFGSNSYDDSIFTGGQVFFAEMLGTMILMFNVLSTIDIPNAGGGPLGVYPIAMSVLIAHLFLLPIDGCSINPTRSFGPSIVAGWAEIPGTYDHQQHVFWFGPLFGASLAAILYEYASLKPENFAGAKDMDTAIFQAGKRKIHNKRPSATAAVEAYSNFVTESPIRYAPNMVDNPLHNAQVPSAPQFSGPSESYAPQSQGSGVRDAYQTQSQGQSHVTFSTAQSQYSTSTVGKTAPQAPPVPPAMQFGDDFNELGEETF